jgi:uncharacterized membrane protein
MKYIPLDAEVQCSDGSCGETVCVIVDPDSIHVTHFVVKEDKRPHTQRLVPLEEVVETTPASIRLGCTKEDLQQMEPFLVQEFRQIEIPRYQGFESSLYYAPEITTLPETKERIPAGKLAVRRGADVQASDGKVGQVDELILDPESGTITHLVLREGHIWGKKDVVLPLSVIDRVDEETVYLKLDRQTIASMLAIPAKQHYGVADVELVVLIMDEPNKAIDAMKQLTQFASEQVAATDSNPVHNAAVLVKDQAGKTSIKELDDVGAKQGTLFGAISGGLIGLLAGPVGAVVGAAAGAATGRIAAKWIDMGFPDEYLKKLQDGLQPGSSALVALVDQTAVTEVRDALAQYEGEFLHQTLTSDILVQLMIEDGASADTADAG